MPFDSDGNFSRIHNWEDDRRNGIEIVTDHHDEEDDNFANGLSQCLLRDGRAPLKDNFDAGNFQIKNLRQANLDDDAVNFAQLKSQISELKTALLANVNSSAKIGDIKMSVLSSNHDNWLLCNGQEVNRADYPDLFKVIGISFGTGNGTTTFNVPDYRGKFIRGLGGDSASDIYTTQAEGLPNITGNDSVAHDTNFSLPSGAFEVFSGSTNGKLGGQYFGIFSGTKKYMVSFDASRSSKIYGSSNHVTPINQALNFFIKAKEEV